MYGGAQPPTHVPAWQKPAALGQALPQAPQFSGSLSTDRQTPPQATVPARHAHAPDTHDAPPPQARSQPPQWFGSVAVSTHSSPQVVCPGAAQPQTPLRQVWLAPHRFPQVPQLPKSLRTSVQTPAHISNPDPQGVGTSGRASGCPSRPTSGGPPSQLLSVQIEADAS